MTTPNAEVDRAFITAEAAVRRALRWITLPSLIVLLGPMITVIGLWGIGVFPEESTIGAVLSATSFAVGFISAWLIWSIRVPQWRLWAYERVNDIAELKRLAVERQIIWPEGSIFERTEIAPAELKRRIEELEEADLFRRMQAAIRCHTTLIPKPDHVEANDSLAKIRTALLRHGIAVSLTCNGVMLVALYAVALPTRDLRARVPILLSSLPSLWLTLFAVVTIVGMMGLIATAPLRVHSIAGVLIGAVLTLFVLDSRIVARLLPVTYETQPRYWLLVIAILIALVTLAVERRSLRRRLEAYGALDSKRTGRDNAA